MKKVLLGGLALVLGAGFGLTALAQTKPDVLVKQRQAKMILQVKYLGPLVGMLKGAPYNAEVVARNARFLEALSEMGWDGFDPSTKDEKSRALPAIWAEPAKFKEAQERLQKATDALAAAAKAGDEAAVKAAIGNVGKACGSCHDDFRSR